MVSEGASGFAISMAHLPQEDPSCPVIAWPVVAPESSCSVFTTFFGGALAVPFPPGFGCADFFVIALPLKSRFTLALFRRAFKAG